MIDKKKMEEVVRRLVAVYSPTAIFLFGSYAWGLPDQDSDLDLMVIVEKSDDPSYRRPIPGYHALHGLGIAKDIVVNTKSEFERQAAMIPTLQYKIKHEGKCLYGKL